MHRTSETARLVDLLHRATPDGPNLRIVGLSGPGGVGKSYLLSHVLDAADPASLGYLRLSVDGSNEQARRDFFGLIDGQLAKASLPPPAKAKHDYFPEVRRVAGQHRALVEAAAAELKSSAAPDELKSAVLGLLRAGQMLNKAVPKTRKLLDLHELAVKDADVASTLDKVWDLAGGLRVLRDASVLPGPVRDALGLGQRERVKNDLYGATADALLSDLSAALGGYLRRDFFRFTQPRVAGLDRLLLIVDDFEALAPTLEEFLVGSLIPRLSDAPFATTLILLGRDDLDAMHPAWAQHNRRYIQEQIRLAPFERGAALAMLTEAGVPEARREELFQATQGFPFLLSLLIEELGSEGADSALFLRKFFDRTTRWMSPREREWFVRICYLDHVNLDALARVFDGEEVEVIQDWFEKEASIRDPAAPVFRVRPLIREKVLRYLELRSPSRHREMLERATKANA